MRIRRALVRILRVRDPIPTGVQQDSAGELWVGPIQTIVNLD